MIGGVRAARMAAADGAHSADAIYAQAAARLGLYTVAFYGQQGTVQERRRLRDAWREARRIGGGQ